MAAEGTATVSWPVSISLKSNSQSDVVWVQLCCSQICYSERSNTKNTKWQVKSAQTAANGENWSAFIKWKWNAWEKQFLGPLLSRLFLWLMWMNICAALGHCSSMLHCIRSQRDKWAGPGLSKTSGLFLCSTITSMSFHPPPPVQ